jgi:hypothetical protein
MKAVLKMIGVASLLGSAACLPSFDQPAAQNTVTNPATPTASPSQTTGDNGVVSPLTPSQQTAIWMQGGDPTLLADRAYDEGPIGIASQRHSCAKMKFNTMGRLLTGRGVAITAGANPATLPVTATTVCPAQSGANTQSTSFVYCTSQLTLGIPQYTARLAESTSVTSGTGTKMMDLYATAATEIEQKLVNNAFPAAATGCLDPKTGAMAVMFNPNNSCNEAGVTCLQGYPATTDQVALCTSIVNQAQASTSAAGNIAAVTAGRRLAIATILAGTQLCE